MQKQIFKNITIQGVTENSFVLFLVGNFDKCHCMEASFETEGCYGDQENHRLLRYHILNEAQKRLTNFWLPFMPDFDSNPLPDFICRCAAKAKKRGFDVFGIKNYGMCRGGSKGGARDARRPCLISNLQTEATLMCDLECFLVKKKKKSGSPIECLNVFATGCCKFLLQDMSVCNPGHPVDYRCESEQYQ